MIPISFEYFPPKTAEQKERFRASHEKLKALGPEYCSVTFGAGGSTLGYTRETVLGLNRDPDTQVAPHLSCLGGSAEEIRELVDTYRSAGIRRIVALRGDVPSGMAAPGEFSHANELVEFIRRQTGDHFTIEVACYPEIHPESNTPEEELKHFKQKVDAGADGAITQYFFNADAYFRLVDDAQHIGIDVPIVPGIMPITNYKQLARFSDGCGAEIPRWLRQRLAAHADDKETILALGTDFVSELCRRLIDGGAPGIHFYTLNRANATIAICRNLGLGDN